MNLRKGIFDKIDELGVKAASKYFGVSAGTISNWRNGATEPSLTAAETVMGIDAQGDTDPEDVDIDALSQWNGRDVILALPVYRSFNPDTHFTLFANYAKYGPEKIGMIQEKRTTIHEARNILVQKFLKTDASYIIMIDDDMILPTGNPSLFNDRYGAKVSLESASLSAISRLMSFGPEKGIVGALYFGRHRRGRAQCHKGFADDRENDKLRTGKYKGLVPDEWVGTGCIRIHRSVFEAMAREIDAGRWPDCAPNGPSGWYGFFTPLKVRVGEDVSFCRRAKEIGIQTYVDTSLVCLHNGEMNWGPSNTSILFFIIPAGKRDPLAASNPIKCL